MLHRYGAIVWYAFGVAWLNSRGVGLLYRLCFVLECGFAKSLYLGLPLSFKAQCLPQIKGGCVWLGAMLLHRHGAIVWYAFGVAWLNYRGVGLL